MRLEIKLRPYQEEAMSNFFAILPEKKRQLIVLPTGSGKTVVFGSIAKKFAEITRTEYLKHNFAVSGPILVMAHRTELLDQAEEKLHMVWPESMVGRVQGTSNELLGDVLVASTQTLVAGRKIPKPSLIIYDECHHARAEGALAVLKRLGVFEEDGPALLGVTATPSRNDRTELGDVFEHITYEKTILEMIVDGYLCDVKGVRVDVPNLELKRLRTTGGDYNQKDLAIVMNHEIALKAVVEAVKTHVGNRKALLFAVDVQHAKQLADWLKLAGIKAESVDGSMSAESRASVLANFAENKIQILVNCQILTEGFDQPDVEAVIIARPTRSQSLYTQMVGRALRLYPEKENALVVDLTGASEDKSLQTFAKLMKTQTVRRKLDNGKPSSGGVKQAETQELGDMHPSESVKEWLLRLAQEDSEEKEATLQFAKAVNLFANRTRYSWTKVNNAFAICYGDNQWVYLLPENRKYWPVLELEEGKYVPLHDESLTLKYAQGVAEGFMELFEGRLIPKDADWRNAPMSQKQDYILGKYRIKHDKTWTRGKASEALNKVFAKKRVKLVVKSFSPDKWREVFEQPAKKEKYNLVIRSLRSIAQKRYA